MMDIRKEETAGRGHYITSVDGHEAKLVFDRSGKTMIIEHVGVPKELEGRGVGSELVRRAVEEAREADWQIVPVCSFAKAKIDQNPDWQDVLKAPGARH